MFSFKAAALVAAIFISINEVSSQQNANPTIPNHLKECYRNSSIYYRGNRLPSNLRTLLDLIRKVESSPTGRNMNARTMSLALQYYLRLDGIVITPTIQQTETIIPFAPGGDEYYKHRLTLVGLLPKANQPGSYAFFNESLTTEELCNLHFMLSYSIDAYKRDDEQCNTNNIETNNPVYPTTTNNYRNYRRWRRSPKKDEPNEKKGSYDADRLEKKHRHAKHLKQDTKNDKSKKKLEKNWRHRRYLANGSDEEQDKNTEVEEIPPAEIQHQNDEKNQDFRIGNQDFLGVKDDHIMRGGIQDGQQDWGTKPRPIAPRPMRPVPDTQRPYLRSQPDKRTAPNVGLSSKTIIPNVQFSDCPIENGVVYTPFGSVTIGTVVAGIAAGLNRQYIEPTLLNVDANDIKPELKGVKVDNLWATTLAGNTADMILSLGIINDINQAVGLKGGWNDTFNPKWYLLQTKDIKYLTDVELRGALDGLWLGKVVTSWIQKYDTLKLSQILDMYYSQVGSVFDPNIQACKRRDNLVQYAPTDEFQQQVHLFCQVMNKQRINTVTFQDFSTFTQRTVDNINNYIPQMDSSCGTRTSLGSVISDTQIDSYNNMLLVVDTLIEYDYFVNFVYYLANAEIVATPYQSNLTILCGKTGEILAVVSDSAALKTNLTREKYKSCMSGLDIGNVYQQLELIYRKIYFEEKNGVAINTQSQVALFLPASSTMQNSSDYTEKRRVFNESFPDVKFLVATTASKDAFSGLVTDPIKDIFTIRLPVDSSSVDSVQQLIRRAKSTPQRIAKTQCGSYYTYEEGSSSVTENIRLGYTKFYRLHPNYFYSADNPTITIASKRGSPLTICSSRTNEQPTADGTQYVPSGSTESYNPQRFVPTTAPNNQYTPFNQNYFRQFARQTDTGTGTGTCKTITSDKYEIQLEDPCDDADSISECAPLYISVYAPRQDANSLSFTCLTCRLPTNVEYQITVDGLSCDSGVGTLIFSPIIALVSVIVICLSNKLF